MRAEHTPSALLRYTDLGLVDTKKSEKTILTMRRAGRRLLTTQTGVTKVDEAGNAGMETFFDALMLSGGRSAAGLERERLLRAPHRFADFFATRKVTPAGLTELLGVQALQGDATGARDSLDRLLVMDGAQVTWVHLNQALAAAARVGDGATFEAVHQQAAELGMGAGDIYTFASMAKCYMKNNETDRALATVQLAKEAGVAVNEVLYGALLSGFGQQGNFSAAETVWAFLKTAEEAPPLDSVLYTAMIHACGRAGQGERALMLLSEMQEDGMVPSEVTLNAALYAVARRPDMWREAKALFAAVKSQGLEPSAYTYAALLLCASRAGDVDSCRRLVADMREMDPASVVPRTLHTFIAGLARGVRAAPPGAERASLVQEAEAVAGQVEMTWKQDDYTRTALLSVYCAGHFLKRAADQFETLGSTAPLAAHTLMLKMYAETGRPAQLQVAWERCCAQPGLQLDAVAFRWAIEGFARAYWVQSAIDVVAAMLKNELMPSHRMLALLRRRCREEDLRKHRWELEEMLRLAQADQDVKLKRSENDTALMMQKLKGDGVRPFLLPFPLLQLKTGGGGKVKEKQ